MPINGVVENKLSRFRDFVDEIRKACAGEMPGQKEGADKR
jgi:hypothetical protein